jgi:threonyl-tRNA synthetase
MIHRALMGSLERFFGCLVEHYAGAFPVWLSPEQVRVIPITDGQNEYATSIADKLKAARVRASADLGTERMNGKIRQAQLMKVPYMLVVGANEAEAGVVSLRMRDGSQLNNIPLAEFEARVRDRIARRASEL